MSEEVFDDAINDSVDVGTDSTLVIARNNARSYALFVNDSDTKMYLAFGADAVLGKGPRLGPNGGFYEFNTTNLYKGPVYAIHGGSGNKSLCIVEGE